MSKKLVKHGNSLALIIDKPLLDILKINEKTELELSIQDNTLIIRSTKQPEQPASDMKSREEEIDAIAERIMTKYEPLFKKLSKT